MLSIAIQAGGNSSRMGEDKALRPFLGQPLIERVIARVRAAGDEVLITANRPEAYQYLGLPVFPDVKPGRGALGGLFTALSCAREPIVAVVACDLPFASSKFIQAAAKILIEAEADVVIAETPGGLEPMHALYRRSTCLPAIERAIEAGAWKAIDWLPEVKVQRLKQEELRFFDPEGLAFLNVNTPEQFAEAEQLASAND
jgi:molybdopterin-guanine dinucleotide biosynthesis protein A